MLLDLSEVMLTLAGEPYHDNGTPLTQGQLLAGKLIEPKNKDVMQFFYWSIDLWKTGKIEIDKAQLEILESLVENAENWNLVWKGRILLKLKALKEKDQTLKIKK